MYNRNVSAFLIFLIELLERASYYGMRAVLILYATSEAGLEMASEDTMTYVGYFAVAAILIKLPLGVITDLFLKQKKAIAIGGGLCSLGFFFLISGQLTLIAVGLVLVIVGGGLVKPNLNVLLGRLYLKQEQQRDAVCFSQRNYQVGEWYHLAGGLLNSNH